MTARRSRGKATLEAAEVTGPRRAARAREIALRLLAARPRTEAQVRARLAREELAGEAEAVISWLRGLGYLDDAEYARARAGALLNPGRLGPQLVEKRLAQEGIAPGAARAAVRQALEAGEEGGRGAAAAELDLCRTLAERRARGTPLAALDGKGRARLARFLAGRGFGGRVVAAVLGIYLDGEG